MNKKIIYISDFFIEHVLGGAEINDNILLYEILTTEIERIQSHLVDSTFLENNINNLFIISNFINLSEKCKIYLQNNCRYIIYEHDHKYIKTRNPGLYKDFKAPKEHVINEDFYKNALKVIVQSKLHKKIIEKNINIQNIFNFGGSLWSGETLKLLEKLLSQEKKEICSIMNSSIGHKNTADAIKFCKFKKIPFRLIESRSYKKFLYMMAANNQFAFFPKTPETLSRVVVEARMLGIKLYINDMIGASHEEWFDVKGKELIKLMNNKKQIIKKEIEILM